MFSQTTNNGFTFTDAATSPRGEKNEAINKITAISFLSFCEKGQIFSCVCVIIFLSGSALSPGTEAVESLPKPHSLSAHSQCYATANYFHSAPTKLWRGREKEKEREREKGEKEGEEADKTNRRRGGQTARQGDEEEEEEEEEAEGGRERLGRQKVKDREAERDRELRNHHLPPLSVPLQ